MNYSVLFFSLSLSHSFHYLWRVQTTKSKSQISEGRGEGRSRGNEGGKRENPKIARAFEVKSPQERKEGEKKRSVEKRGVWKRQWMYVVLDLLGETPLDRGGKMKGAEEVLLYFQTNGNAKSGALLLPKAGCLLRSDVEGTVKTTMIDETNAKLD